jgi:hypothetical protein
MLVFSASDYLWFVDQALDRMVSIVSELGDEGSNRRVGLDGANSPYAILTHCLGVMEYWGGFYVAGRAVDRDRDAEFTAVGSVSELITRSAVARHQLEADLLLARPTAAPANPPQPEDADLPFGRSQGAVLLHIYEELAQHLGHMEITRDLLLAGDTSRT